MLKLGKKYDVEYQYKRAIQCLQQSFPSTLRDWDIRGKAVGTLGATIKPYAGILFDIIKLALETNTLSILPVVYLFLLSRHSTVSSSSPPKGHASFFCPKREILNGYEVTDESNKTNSIKTTIPLDVALTCNMARDEILEEARKHTFSWLVYDNRPAGALCTNPASCSNSCNRIIGCLWTRPLTPVSCFYEFDLINRCAQRSHNIGRHGWNELLQ